MGEELQAPAGISGIIPHFWFDLLARVIPGAYFIAGCYWISFGIDVPSTLPSLQLLTLLFLAAYFLGVLLGHMSYCLEWLPWKKQRTAERVKNTLRIWYSEAPTATILSKWNAEEVQARSIACASFMLVIITLIVSRRSLPTALAFGGFGAAAVAGYRYYRDRQIDALAEVAALVDARAKAAAAGK